MHNHIGDDRVFVTRSRRGEWGEWFEKWLMVVKKENKLVILFGNTKNNIIFVSL